LLKINDVADVISDWNDHLFYVSCVNTVSIVAPQTGPQSFYCQKRINFPVIVIEWLSNERDTTSGECNDWRMTLMAHIFTSALGENIWAIFPLPYKSSRHHSVLRIGKAT